MQPSWGMCSLAGSISFPDFCLTVGGYFLTLTFALYLRLLLKQMQELENKNVTDDFQATAYYQMHAGYAFAAFSYILGTLLLFIGAIYISPLICGSANERMMLKSPSEIDGGYASNNRNEPRTQI